MSGRSYALLTAISVCLVLVVGSQALAQQQPDVTIESLLQQMVDMQRLATRPHPAAECDQQSSYDRASVSPDEDNWFANGDAGKFIRTEKHNGRTEHVMAEMDGPGAIVRLWSANPEGGETIRIYIDDMQQPALQADFRKLTSAEMADFPAPFSGRRSRGANLYFPIPYQNRCKVTVSKPGLYYHVGYRTFPDGTSVQPFSMSALADVQETMQKVGQILGNPAEPFTTEGAQQQYEWTTVSPGAEAELTVPGPAAIVRAEVDVNVPKGKLSSALRKTVLTIQFDDEAEPSVWAPLGDFFGSQPGINPYESLPVGMTESGMCYCNWYIPFGRQARVTLHNYSDTAVDLDFSLWLKPHQWQPERDLYFHAKWRKQWLPASPRFLDWPILKARGTGRFAGVMLGVMNTQRGWWGEGDEKVWVDDDDFPSFFGTGTEDYFGYAWCNPGLFEHAYHNQSIVTGPGNFGYTSVARYHILDDIPFDESIRFFIEKWASADREYCCTSYWYAAPGSTDFFEPVPPEELRVRPLPEPFHVEGALEGEKLEIARRTGGTTQVQDVAGKFSYGRHLWWRELSEGDILELSVPVDETGRYRLIVNFTKSWDYGIHQPMVNGEDVGDPLDLYQPEITPLKVDFGVFDLEKGSFRFGLRCVGTNPEAEPVNYMAGIDYVLLEPVE